MLSLRKLGSLSTVMSARGPFRLCLLGSHLAKSCVQNRDVSAKAVLDTRKSTNVLDSYMSYLDAGKGENLVVFLHGNPTSAFLWRNIIPHVQPVARCVAPDLIGMGHSGKPDIEYRFVDHYKYLCQWIDQMDFPDKITVVCHDWGSALGFNWCQMHPDRVQAIVFMEAVVATAPDWENIPAWPREIYQQIRSPGGEQKFLKDTSLVESVLPWGTIRQLSDEEMAEYLLPYKDTAASRMPLVTWCKEVAVVSSGPDNMIQLIHGYRKWLRTTTDIPKLYIHTEPGVFSLGNRHVSNRWPNVTSTTVKGLHFVQEDSPDEIGQAIRKFLENLY